VRGATHDDGSGSQWRRRARPEEGCLSRQREPLPSLVEDLPDLSPSYGAALDRGLASLRLILPPDVRQLVDAHVRYLLAWNAAINLSAVREPEAIAIRHVVDSLSGVAVLRRLDADALLDLGAGGGFPGLPLAVATPVGRALLVESVAKKARFLETVTIGLGLVDRIAVAADRAESLARDRAHRERWPVVTARAVASLSELVELAFPLLSPGGSLLAWKSAGSEPEVASAQRAMDGLGGGGLAMHAVELPGLHGHRLVEVTKHGRTPAAFPRDPARRRQRPW
jgi:16S rRNA (guanine527-N7)-methyltransferase